MQIAVLKETEGKGPYCSLVMAVIVMKDVLVFMCFALNIEFARVVRFLSLIICLGPLLPGVSGATSWVPSSGFHLRQLFIAR